MPSGKNKKRLGRLAPRRHPRGFQLSLFLNGFTRLLHQLCVENPTSSFFVWFAFPDLLERHPMVEQLMVSILLAVPISRLFM